MKQIEKGLISGKEALIALANGEEVEFKHNCHGWVTCLGLNVEQIMGSMFQMRIKPKPMLLNGIEIPVSFEPEEGDEVWFIDSDNKRGYSSDTIGQGCEEYWIQFGAWRSEDEIEQVVAALRKVFKGQ